MRFVFSLLLFSLGSSVLAQSSVTQNKYLKGTWVKTEGLKDTLKFYFDNDGIDFAVQGVLPENRHGYFMKFIGDSMQIEGMCSGEVDYKVFKIDFENSELIIQDFYNNTNENLVFRKISDKIW